MTNWLNWKSILIGTLVLLLLIYLVGLMQTPDKVIEDVVVFEENNRAVLQVKFNMPVRYENHFPESRSRFLQIKLRTITLGEVNRNEYINSDAILPGFLEKIPLADLAFEGKVPDGPYLSLRFREPVSYQVQEDVGLRSIFINLPIRQ